MNTHFRCLLLAGAGALALASSLLAQTDATVPTATDQSAIVKLSAFDVSAPIDHGYVATDSTLGTRVATQIQDLPFSVEIVTSQLMKDVGFFEMDENISFVSSFSGLSQGGQYNLRGFNQSIPCRTDLRGSAATAPLTSIGSK